MNHAVSPRAHRNRSGERTVSVLQGEVFITDESDDVLTTILGSCVAVCMWDPIACVGGMNHFLLPRSQGQSGDTIKYGANAMELLINGLLRKGATRGQLVCKLFGGASMGLQSGRIGKSNITFARSFLQDERVPCLAESLGGNEARRIRFWPTSGHVKLMIVPRVEVDVDPSTTAPEPKKRSDEITLF